MVYNKEQYQCPESGEVHFYIFTIQIIIPGHEGVNALNRAKFISTLINTTPHPIVFQCQCPKSGEVHFYSVTRYMPDNSKVMCQCPKSGEVHFYMMNNKTITAETIKYQCPKSGEVHFYEHKHKKKVGFEC